MYKYRSLLLLQVPTNTDIYYCCRYVQTPISTTPASTYLHRYLQLLQVCTNTDIFYCCSYAQTLICTTAAGTYKRRYLLLLQVLTNADIRFFTSNFKHRYLILLLRLNQYRYPLLLQVRIYQLESILYLLYRVICAQNIQSQCCHLDFFNICSRPDIFILPVLNSLPINTYE